MCDLAQSLIQRTDHKILFADEPIDRKSVTLFAAAKHHDVGAIDIGAWFAELQYAPGFYDPDRCGHTHSTCRRTLRRVSVFKNELHASGDRGDRRAFRLHHAINAREWKCQCFAANIDKQRANHRERDRKIEFKHRSFAEFGVNTRNTTDLARGCLYDIKTNTTP